MTSSLTSIQIFVLSALCAFVLSLTSAEALSASSQEEVSVERVLYPSTGYDDNDEVRMVIEGVLPDACYRADAPIVEVDEVNHQILIHQFATRSNEGGCATGDQPPEADFSEALSLGRLHEGSYAVVIQGLQQPIADRRISIRRALSQNVDDYPFAWVQRVAAPDLALEGRVAKVVVQGHLSSICHVLDEISVERDGDAFVIRPIEAAIPDCLATPEAPPRAFTRTVDLEPLTSGRYLIQVRSHEGEVFERTFTVVRTSL